MTAVLCKEGSSRCLGVDEQTQWQSQLFDKRKVGACSDQQCRREMSRSWTLIRRIGVGNALLPCAGHGVGIAWLANVSENSKATTERRSSDRSDRRENSRGGRRGSDPHVNWQRVAWLFALYAIFMSVRSLPSTVWKFFKSERTAAG